LQSICAVLTGSRLKLSQDQIKSIFVYLMKKRTTTVTDAKVVYTLQDATRWAMLHKLT